MMVSDELEKTLTDVQAKNQQLQAIAMQKQAMQVQLHEAERALTELGKMPDNGEAFKAVGPILVKSSKPNLTKETTELKEEIELRIKTMEKQEGRIRENLQGMQEKLQTLIKGEPS
jgi:prefoldin beta subunit